MLAHSQQGWWTHYVDAAQVLGAASTALGAIIAAASLIGIFIQTKTSAAIARETMAMDAHKEYIKLCIDKPELSSSSFALAYVGIKSFDGILASECDKKTEEVLWFLSYVLFTSEQILSVTRRGQSYDPAWLATIRDQLGYHQETLKAVWPAWRDHYSVGLGAIMDDVLRTPLRPDGLLDD